MRDSLIDFVVFLISAAPFIIGWFIIQFWLINPLIKWAMGVLSSLQRIAVALEKQAGIEPKKKDDDEG